MRTNVFARHSFRAIARGGAGDNRVVASDDTINIPTWSGPANSLSIDGGIGTDTIQLLGNSNPNGILATVVNVESIVP